MPNLTTGSFNVAVGRAALNANTTGDTNVATGAGRAVLQHHRQQQRRQRRRGAGVQHDRQQQRRDRHERAHARTRPASNNIATGNDALSRTRPATQRRDRRPRAGFANTIGIDNIATGPGALFSNMTGDNNVATGVHALSTTRPATTTSPPAINAPELATTDRQSDNVAIGRNAGKNLTTGSNNIDIANAGKAGESGTIRIGTDGKQTATFIAGISGTPSAERPSRWSSTSNGQLGTAPARSASTSHRSRTSSACRSLERQQRQIERLREQVKGG